MKNRQIFTLLCAFCGYLGADAAVEHQDQPNELVTFDFSSFTELDIHQQFKNIICMFFSQAQDEDSFTEIFSDPLVKTYLENLEGLEKKASIQRLYALVIASEILSTKGADITTGALGNFKALIEQEHDLTLPNYRFLQLSNENRFPSAYVLYLINSIALTETMLKFEDYEEVLSKMNLQSNHSKRMILTIMKIIPYIALEEASNLFAGDETSFNEVESISIDFHRNKISISECADRINSLFK